ncbi:MAG: methyl-accepting chemotaxis protein [Pseudomonadota bacterium]
MRFSNLKIGAKLAAAFVTILILTAITGMFSVSQLGRVNGSTQDIATSWLPSIRILGEIDAGLNEYRRAEIQLVLAVEPKGVEENEKRAATARKRIDDAFAKYEPTINSPDERKLFDQLKQMAQAHYANFPKLLPLAQGGDAQHDAAKAFLNGESRTTFRVMASAITKLIELNDKGADAAYKDSQSTFSTARAWVIALLMLATVAASFLAFWITGLITRPMARANEAASQIAGGDLSQPLQADGKDETASLLRSLETMRLSLVDVVGQVRMGSESVATASAEIAQGNQDLSSRTESQASALEETAASMEELSSTVKQNADSARQANQLAMSASTVAMRGGAVVGQVVETMKGINDSSKRISDIISVIDGIAFQTNILALNAAVEAARAGEQGRGFAVVASEVRALAGRSADAAKEIKQLINASVERVEQGTDLVDQAGVTMTEVVDSIRRVTDIMGEISAASSEQASGVAQIGEAVQQMDHSTQQNAALVEQMAAAASSLKTQAQELVQVVAVFKDGKSSHQPVAAVSAVRSPQARGKPFAGNERRNDGISKGAAARGHAPAKPAAPRPAALQAPKAPVAKVATAAAGGGDGDWETF